MAKMSLGKGLDALFPPNVNVNTLGDKNEINDASENVIEMKINSIDTKQVELTQRLIIVETKLNEHIDNKIIHNIKGEQL